MSSAVGRVYVSFSGRISRGTFWLAQGALILGFAVLFVFLDHALGHGSTWALYPPFYWAAFAVSIKRLHDRGHSAWRLLILLIPVLGPLWWLISLGVLSGTRGDNQYGPDPIVTGVDYLVVRSEP
jgi:uncharacterized membrane protein YhaH (DUF805 family)